jgi:hypothetical protein
MRESNARTRMNEKKIDIFLSLFKQLTFLLNREPLSERSPIDMSAVVGQVFVGAIIVASDEDNFYLQHKQCPSPHAILPRQSLPPTCTIGSRLNVIVENVHYSSEGVHHDRVIVKLE